MDNQVEASTSNCRAKNGKKWEFVLIETKFNLLTIKNRKDLFLFFGPDR